MKAVAVNNNRGNQSPTTEENAMRFNATHLPSWLILEPAPSQHRPARDGHRWMREVSSRRNPWIGEILTSSLREVG